MPTREAMLGWLDELSGAGIFSTDTELVLRSWNRWMERNTGIAADQAIGRPLFEVCPDVRARGLDRYYEATLAGEVSVLAQSLHRYVVRMTGTLEPNAPMPQSGRIAPLIDGGVVIGTITVIEDVSERVRSEQAMRRQIVAAEEARTTAETALRIKDEFLANLSHEIRTPLNAVIGWTRILLSRKCDEATIERALRVIDRNAGAQAKLIEDMLDMARIVSGKLRLNVAPLDLANAAKAAIEVIAPAAEAKGVTIRTDIGDAPRPIVADADRVQQIAWNILSNAVKFTPSGGTITARVDETSSSVSLIVTDTGDGIAPDFLPHVFERFRQANASTSRIEGGLGLGLALVQELVHLHGGRIFVTSPGLGRGSTFTVAFPAPAHHPVTQLPLEEDVSAARLSGERILIVDDDPDWRDLLSLALGDVGARPLVAASSSEAVALLAAEKTPPRVVVTDIAMPVENGYVFLARLRALGGAFETVPVIAVTAYAGSAEEARARRAGFQMFRAKPLAPRAAIAAIVEALGEEV